MNDLAFKTARKMQDQGVSFFERILRLRRDFGLSLLEAKELDHNSQSGRTRSLWELQEQLARDLEAAE